MAALDKMAPCTQAVLLYLLTFVFMFPVQVSCMKVKKGGLSLKGHTSTRPVVVSPLVPMSTLEDSNGATRRATMQQSGGLRGSSSSGTSVGSGLRQGTEISERQMRALRMFRRSGRASVGRTLAASARNNGNVGGEKDTDRARVPGISLLADVLGAEYVGLVGVGNTSDPFLRLIFDTGSADLWVASDLCTRGPCTDKARNRYNQSKSSTARSNPIPEKLETSYASGKLRGSLGQDDVRVGPLVARGQALGLISEEIGSAFEKLPIDGILGLGFPAAATSEGTRRTLVDTLIQQHMLPSREFAFYFHPNVSVGGAVLWGGVDTRLFKGSLMWFPVTQPFYWEIELVSARIGTTKLWTHRHSLWKSDPYAIVDSGTTFFTMPFQIFEKFQRELGGHAHDCRLLHRLPDMVFTLRDVDGNMREIVVTPEQFMVNIRGSNECLSGIVGMRGPKGDGDPMFIFGEVFMRHFFTAFRREAQHPLEQACVGLAPSVRGGDDVNAFFAESLATESVQ